MNSGPGAKLDVDVPLGADRPYPTQLHTGGGDASAQAIFFKTTDTIRTLLEEYALEEYAFENHYMKAVAICETPPNKFDE